MTKIEEMLPERVSAREPRCRLTNAALRSERFRSQRQNLEDALRKIQDALDEAAQAAFPPPPNEVEKTEEANELFNRKNE